MKNVLTKKHPRMQLHRKHAAELARDIRAMWPSLKGDWTRRDWNNQVLSAAHNHISGMLAFDRANQPEVLK